METTGTVCTRTARSGFMKYLICFAVTVVIGLVLLIFSAYLPQSLIAQHIIDSADMLYHDMEDMQTADRSTASTLDVGTDLMMLRTSIATTDDYLGSVLTNPVYYYSDIGTWEGKAEEVLRLAYGMPHDGSWSYGRYWLGFRVLLRLALVFLDYTQIKRYLAVVFFLLMAAAMCSVAQHTNSKLAFLFAVSMILVRPHVIATSMQFTSCFLIAFAAMLLVPWLHRNPKYEALFFMETGMITMYFDFYTVPLITLGYPLVYLYALQAQNADQLRLKRMATDGIAWFAGWGFMWIAKLVLTTLLTSENALASGLTSFFTRIGVKKEVELEEYYDLTAAFDGIREAVFSDSTGKVIYLLVAALVLLFICRCFIRAKTPGSAFVHALPLAVLAVVPLIWFVITKQPIAIHYFFQYRTIALTHWAAGAYVWSVLQYTWHSKQT